MSIHPMFQEHGVDADAVHLVSYAQPRLRAAGYSYQQIARAFGAVAAANNSTDAVRIFEQIAYSIGLSKQQADAGVTLFAQMVAVGAERIAQIAISEQPTAQQDNAREAEIDTLKAKHPGLVDEGLWMEQHDTSLPGGSHGARQATARRSCRYARLTNSRRQPHQSISA